MSAETDSGALLKMALLPLISLLVAIGMYILNDLVDADLDRANGKKRPIPTGRVSKNQAWFFVISTNGLAVLLSLLTDNMASILIVLPMLAIGIMYSAPRVALMNRFVVKTLSISAFYSLCALLGITSAYGTEIALNDPVVPAFSMALLGVMIFISSTLNDLGDIDGDRAAGRRTLPVVMGARSVIRFLTVLSGGIVALPVVLCVFVGPVTVSLVAVFATLLIFRLNKIGEGLEKMDAPAIRKNHAKIFPMHMLLQLLLVVGTLALL